DALGCVAQEAVAVTRPDQPGEQLEVAAQVEYVRVGADHDVGQGGGGTVGRGGRGLAALDGLACEQAQFAEQARREAGAVGGVLERLARVHVAPVRGVGRVVRYADRGQVRGGGAVQQFNVHVEVPLTGRTPPAGPAGGVLER